MPVKPIPDNYPRVIPYLIVKDVDKLLNFLSKVFKAEIKERMTLKDGTVNHATVKIGNSIIMMGKANNNYPPQQAMLYIYVENTDDTYNKALKEKAESIMKPKDQFYGDRNAAVKDSSGISWWIATHVKDVSPEEMEKLNKEN
jgi:PhnB protein